ncbi:hypothetical protein [uncultured Acidaminococcus sp.]|uniref:hypothetical protein n=1 Tax=uncultured Acidaminococcus sp. TaxID=352152 RepID=UPI00266FE25E|nr:hypothetical protein [uncultured Acidaminococcus sp.]
MVKEQDGGAVKMYRNQQIRKTIKIILRRCKLKLRYKGFTFGVEGLTDNKVYPCLGVEGPFFRIIDDSDEDYLYSKRGPAPLEGSIPPGRWEIVKDDENGTLKRALTFENIEE